MKRRSFLIGAASLIAAPAIIRVADLMKISPQPFDPIVWEFPPSPPGFVRTTVAANGRTIGGNILRASDVASKLGPNTYFIKGFVSIEEVEHPEPPPTPISLEDGFEFIPYRVTHGPQKLSVSDVVRTFAPMSPEEIGAVRLALPWVPDDYLQALPRSSQRPAS